MPKLNYINSLLPHELAHLSPGWAHISPEMVRIPVACRGSGISRSGLYRLAADGKIRMVKLAGRTLVDMASVRAFLASLPNATIRAARRA